jgi:hypothetical protein
MPMTVDTRTYLAEAAPAATMSSCRYGFQEPRLDRANALAGRSLR